MQNSGEIVYGVCLPATGFSALFVVISLITVISILVSGFVCYQRQMQKVAEESAPKKVTAAMGAPTAQQVRGGIHVQNCYNLFYVLSISSRGVRLIPNLLYSPLEDEGPPLFPQLSHKLLNKCSNFPISRNRTSFFCLEIIGIFVRKI
jgi:hypothetical protein